MSFGFTIDVSGDARPQFARVIDNLRRPDLRKVMGRAIATKLRTHFSERDKTKPNKLGGKRTHFWGDVRRSVQQPQLIGGDGIQVAVNHVGAAQSFFGGDIEPVNVDWLTIPARAESYGKRAREFDDLHFVFFRAGLAALVQNEQTSLVRPNQNRKKDRGVGPIAPETTGGGIFYWLVDHVYQKPDPTVLPEEEELRDVAFDAGDKYLTAFSAN